jgi:hypothetical protein
MAPMNKDFEREQPEWMRGLLWAQPPVESAKPIWIAFFFLLMLLCGSAFATETIIEVDDGVWIVQDDDTGEEKTCIAVEDGVWVCE